MIVTFIKIGVVIIALAIIVINIVNHTARNNRQRRYEEYIKAKAEYEEAIEKFREGRK